MASKQGNRVANGMSGKVGLSEHRNNGAPEVALHKGIDRHTNGTSGVNGKVNGATGVKA